MSGGKPHPLLPWMIGSLTTVDFLQNGLVAFGAAPIMGEIGASPEEFSVVAAMYASVAVVVIALHRWCVERLGWRRYIQATLLAAAAGAALCARAEAVEQFLLGRMVMAAGCAGMLTSARLAVNLIPPGPGRFRGIRALALGLCGGMAAAPWLAATLVTADGWPMLFWLVAGLSLVALIPAARVLPNEPHPKDDHTDFHPAGLAALTLGSFLLLFSMQRSYYDFYADEVWPVVGAVAGAIAMLGFAHAESRRPEPLLRIRGMAEPRFVAGLALFTCCYVVMGANGYVIPAMLQRALGHSWAITGQFYSLGLLAGVLTCIVMMQIVGRWPAPRKYLLTGFGALAASSMLLTGIVPEPDLWVHVLPALALYGVFLMTVLPTAAMQTFGGVAYDDMLFSHAQQVKNMLAQVGQAAGIMLATVGQQWLTTEHYATLNTRMLAADPAFQHVNDQLTTLFAGALGAGQGAQLAIAQLGQMLLRQSLLLANLDHFRVLAAVAVVGLVVSLIQRVFR